MTAGVLLVDKPSGMTSHDVVARARRALGTRKIGHAGTLDPMATGLLVLGVDGATRLLTYVVGLDKTYEATIRLGAITDTDDADGEIQTRTDAAAVSLAAVAARISELTGTISQVPSRVSAIKVAGRRAYDLARAGEEVELAAREVTVSRFDVRGHRRPSAGSGTGSDGSGTGEPLAEFLDLDVVVDCTSGTYIRALARDLGAALGVGGHLTALRRTRIGPFAVAGAATLEDLATHPLLSPGEAASAVLGVVSVSADEARDLRHGKRLAGAAARLDPDQRNRPAAAIDADGVLVGIVERRGEDIKSAMNMPQEVAS
ncbi:tRNA pseudouridine(55) synthase TruB [Microbacterium pygmaeum]|uniref:tRNA pseudouridine synthase B n=1 Tax=Microbacterium pygmaeum TaxID=370764 RepID=A0A1G8C4G8_9MICO|nr:tRNA pseudouridine(55) synthase TruB [Microbacterium pygmaeum]SDH40302.1 tRNA pseudouridine synthase B [Microbacterium pygmaeum]